MSVNMAPQTWIDGTTPDGTDFNRELRDPLTGLQAVWDTYTPVWAASGSNPSMGNGTLTGRYLQVGHAVDFSIALNLGTTTTLGSGTYTFTLPVAAHSFTGVVVNATQSNPVALFIGRGASSTTIQLYDVSGTAVLSAANTDLTNASALFITGRYESA